MPRIIQGTTLAVLMACSYCQAGPANGYTTLFSRILGGSDSESVASIASDPQGNIYITGSTASTNFPGTSGLPSGTNDNYDVFVIKLDAAGNTIYTKLIGGHAYDYATAIAADALGNAYVTGYTFSTNFPRLNSVQPGLRGVPDCFVFKLDASGTTLLYSSLVGGGSFDAPSGIAVAAGGEVVIAGQTYSSDFPTTPGGSPVQGLGEQFYSDAFVTRLGSSGSNLIFSTCLGGASYDYAAKVRLDADGNAFVAGSTRSDDFPTTTNAYQRFLGGSEPGGFTPDDVFLTKLNPLGAIVYSTLCGGADSETLYDLAVDQLGRAYIAGGAGSIAFLAGRNISPGFPQMPVEYPPQPFIPEGFVIRLEPSGSAMSFVKRFGGTGGDNALAISLNSSGNIAVLGSLGQTRFVGELDSTGSNFLRAGFVGQCSVFSLTELAAGLEGSLYLAGSRGPQSPGGQLSEDSGYDGFITRVSPPSPVASNHPPAVSFWLADNNTVFGSNQAVPLRIDVADLDGDLPEIRIYAGAQLLAQFATNVSAFSWTNPPVGVHSLFAVAVDDFGLCTTSCPVNISVVVPPANDSFRHSTRLVGESFIINASNAGAGTEPGEPQIYPDTYRYTYRFGGGHTVWWCWTAPAAGTYAISVSSLTYHSVSVLRAPEFIVLGSASSAPDDPGRVAFKATTGATYHFAVDSAYVGDFTLTLTSALPPPNDDYANRIPITGSNVVVHASNTDATFEFGLPFSYELPASVWWAWASPKAGTYVITVESTIGHQLSVLRRGTPSPGPLVNIVLPPPFGIGGQRHVVTAAASNEVFDLRVWSDRKTGPFTLKMVPPSPPANDNFADAVLLPSLNALVAGSTFGATAEVGEPSHAPPAAAASSVWYKWIAPSNGNFNARLSASPYTTIAAIYTGSDLSNLSLVTRVETHTGSVRFPATAGTHHFIAIEPYSTGIDFTFAIQLAPVVTNDDFANRQPFTGWPVTVVGSTHGATFENGEPQHLLSETNPPTIWYSWVAPSNGTYTASVGSSSGSLGLAVYRGSALGDLVRVSPMFPYTSSRFITQFDAEAGGEYSFAVIGNVGSEGAIRLDLRSASPPANDNFANRIALSGSSISLAANNLDATLQTDEPIVDSFAEASVWWSWTAPHTGRFFISLDQSSAWHQLRIFTGNQLDQLFEAWSIESSSTYALFEVDAGEQFQIVVVGQSVGLGQGPFRLKIETVARPPNDDFADADVLNGSTALVWQSTTGATSEPEEFIGGPSVWWQWTAPASGLTTIILSLDFTINVYTGTSLASLEWVASSPGFPQRVPSVGFHAVAGTTYWIAVRGLSTTSLLGLYLSGPEPPVPMHLRSLQRLPDGRFQFGFEATIGQTNVVETSTDLLEWTPIMTNVIDCSTFILDDAGATNFTRRFYRLRTQ